MDKFDEIVSLGYNCEISFRIEDYFGKLNAMLFSWSYVLSREKFPDILRNTSLIFSEGETLCEDHMIQCNRTGLKFHPRYSVLPKVGEVSEEQYREAVEELYSRVRHLSEKFCDLCKSEKRTLFVIKLEDKGTEENVRFIRMVKNALDEIYISQNYVLTVVTLKTTMTPELSALQDEKIRIFSVKKFAPQKHTNIMGDVRGWYRLFYAVTGIDASDYFRSIRARRWRWFKETVCRKLHIR